LAPPFGRLAGRIGQRPILIPGGVISAAAALFLLSRVDAAPAYLAVWLPFTLVSGVGVSMVLPLLTSAAVAGLPSHAFAPRSALRGLRRGARRERRAPQPGTAARRRHLRGPGRTNGGRRAAPTSSDRLVARRCRRRCGDRHVVAASASRRGDARDRARSSPDRNTPDDGIEAFTDRRRRTGNDSGPSGAPGGFFMTDTI